MKKFKISLLIILMSSFGYSQLNIYKFIIEDSVRSESVAFGLNNSSTIGIDTSLGESNIYNQPFDSFEVRVIQRDTVNHNCLKTPHNKNVYSPFNIDSKIDYRPLLFIGFDEFETINMNFEIQIKSEFYPYQLYADFSSGIFSNFSSFQLLDSNCNVLKNLYMFGGGKYLIDTLYNNDIYNINVHIEYETGTENNNQDNILFYPNPSKGTFNISNPQSILNMQVFNIYGQQIQNCVREDEISLSDHPAGVYFVRMEMLNGEVITKNLVKE